MSTTPPKIEVRKGSPSPRLGRAEFEKRFLAQFADPLFKALPQELAAVAGAAWQAYQQGRKSPNTRQAGPEFADPNYDLSVDWLDAREAIQSAQHNHRTEAPSLAHQLLSTQRANLPP